MVLLTSLYTSCLLEALKFQVISTLALEEALTSIVLTKENKQGGYNIHASLPIQQWEQNQVGQDILVIY